ncbi:MAG: MerR family transcriptional regulator [Bacillota bacterium]|nr:MerR family transcriptional regulator [Bacillota bacterium]
MSAGRNCQSEEPIYPMGVVERLTGLTGRRIRYYEKKGLIAPARSQGNHRLYSERDIARLRWIGELMNRGLTTGMVRLILEKSGQGPTGRGPEENPPLP